MTNVVSDVSLSLTGTLTASLDGAGNSSIHIQLLQSVFCPDML